MPHREYFQYHHHNRQAWPGGALVSRLGAHQASVANPQQEPQVNRMADLPTLLLQRVIGLLDHGSRLELRRVDKRCRQSVDSCWRLVCIPLDHLRQHSMKQLTRRFLAAECLVVSEAEQRISLSVLGHRRRCEQLLSVFLDNTVPWLYLVALDLSHALTSISANCLELLSSNLSSLQHLALPKVAASTEFAHAPAHEILHLVSSMQQLRSLELDCSLLLPKSNNHGSSGSPRGQDKLPAFGDQVANHQQPLLLQDVQQQGPVRLFSGTAAAPAVQSPSTAGPSAVTHVPALHVHEHAAEYAVDGSGSGIVPSSDSSGPQQPVDSTISYASSSEIYSNSSSHAASSNQDLCGSDSKLQQVPVQKYFGMHMCNPWFQLHHMVDLQQLQLVNPSTLQDVLPALAGLRDLGSLSLSSVRPDVCSLLLEAGHSGSCGNGLGMLQHLKLLTRLELGLEQPCRSCNGSSVLPPKLIVPPHSSVENTAAAQCQRFSCCWSHLQQLKVLVLSGICLDCSLIAATADCVQLTELRVGGAVLEHEIHLAALRSLQELKVLSVSQCFDLGGNNAAALFPGLTKLSIRDGSDHCPDLSCLKHHPTLSSLSIEAIAGWQLSSLQLGYLVHVTSLKQLSLASKWCGGSSGLHHQPLPHQQALASPGRPGLQPQLHGPLPHMWLALKSPCRGGLAGSNSAHWLPSASLTQVTSLTLSGPCNDHTLSQLPNQFPGMVSLQLLGSYYTSDQGLKRLCRAPQLSALLLDGCDHVTEYGIECVINSGSIRVLVVQGCGGVDERACQRIRRACRNSCTCLHWHGTDGSRGSYGGLSNSSGSSHISPYFDVHDSHHHHHHHHHSQHVRSSSNSSLDAGLGGVSAADVFSGCDGSCHCSSGSAFLKRCWQEAEAEKASTASSGSTAARSAGLRSPMPHDLLASSTSTCRLGSSIVGGSSNSNGSRLAGTVQEEVATLHCEADTNCHSSAAVPLDCTATETVTVSAGVNREPGTGNMPEQQGGVCLAEGTTSNSSNSTGAFRTNAPANTTAVAASLCTTTCLLGTRRNSESCFTSAAGFMPGPAAAISIVRSSSSSSGMDIGAGSSSGGGRSRRTSCVPAGGDGGGLRGVAASWPRHNHAGQTAAH